MIFQRYFFSYAYEEKIYIGRDDWLARCQQIQLSTDARGYVTIDRIENNNKRRPVKYYRR